MMKFEEGKKVVDEVPVPGKLDFINKEFTQNKITSKLLSDLLLTEERRKAQLEARMTEINQGTKARIREEVKELAQSVSSLRSRAAVLRNLLAKAVRENLPDRVEDAEIYVKLDEIDYLEKSRDYVLVIHFVMLTSTKLNSHLRDRNYSEAIAMFNQLRSLRDLVLITSAASNATKYCSGVLATWESELYETVASELSSSFDKVGWPSRIDTANPTEDTLKRFQNTVRCFARLTTGKIPKPETEYAIKPVILADFRELSPLVDLLLKPIRKRFRYHFYSSKATADDTKPEWYFAQVNQWIRDLLPFLSTYVEPIQMDVCGTSAIMDFLQGLAQLLVLKTDTLLRSTAQIDDIIFSKLLEESRRFESDMKLILEDCKLDKKEELPGFVSTIFSQPQVLDRWLAIEKRGSLEKLDILFSSTSAWNRVVVPGPTEIAELFVMMLRFIIDRFSSLRQPGQKIQFVQLVIEILEDFRLRCLQVWKSGSDNTKVLDNMEFLVAETLGYIHGILQEWEETTFFATLDFFWNSIRLVEKEDLEQRSGRGLSDFTSKSDEDREESPKRGVVFQQVREAYASSMEMILISISQR